MKKLYISLLAGLSFFNLSNAQSFDWVTTVENGENNQLAVDPSGNTYVYGFINGSVTLGTTTFNMANGGNYLAMYNTSGALMNAIQLNNISVLSMEATASSLYIAGQYGTGSSIGSTMMTGATDNQEAFFAQLNTSLGVTMTKTGNHMGSSESFNGIDVDNAGNIYIASDFRGDSISVGTSHFTGTDDFKEKALLLKFLPTGTVVYGKVWELSGNGDMGLDDLKVDDASGNIFVTGYSSDDVNMDSVMFGAINYKPGYLAENEFVAVLTNTGDGIDIEDITGIHQEGVTNLDIDHTGNSYITVNHYVNGFSVIKLNATLDTVWTSTTNGSSGTNARDLDVDMFGNVYVAGEYNGMVDFPGTAYDESNPNTQGFLEVLSTTSGALTAVHMLSSSSSSFANAVGTDVTGDVYLGGKINGSTDFNGTNVTVAAESGYLAKMGTTATSISSQSSVQNYSLFPNPCTDLLYISNSNDVKEAKIFDVNGKLVYSLMNNGSQLRLPVSGLTDGIYLLQLSTEEKITSARFIKK